MWKAIAIGASILTATAHEVYGQAYVELGASIGHACLMAEASCADEVVTRGVQAGIWLTEKTAIRFRFLDAPRPDVEYQLQHHRLRWSDRSRSLWLGEASWHFGAPHPARIFVGVSAGARVDREHVECAPVPCAEIPPTVISIGTAPSKPHFTLGAVGGVSIHPIRRLVLILQAGSHDFPGEQVGTFVLSAHAVYRHPIGK